MINEKCSGVVEHILLSAVGWKGAVKAERLCLLAAVFHLGAAAEDFNHDIRLSFVSLALVDGTEAACHTNTVLDTGRAKKCCLLL